MPKNLQLLLSAFGFVSAGTIAIFKTDITTVFWTGVISITVGIGLVLFVLVKSTAEAMNENKPNTRPFEMPVNKTRLQYVDDFIQRKIDWLKSNYDFLTTYETSSLSVFELNTENGIKTACGVDKANVMNDIFQYVDLHFGSTSEKGIKHIIHRLEVFKQNLTDADLINFEPPNLRKFESEQTLSSRVGKATRLDSWFDFLHLKIKQGTEIYNNPLVTYKMYIDYYEQILEGLKTSLDVTEPGFVSFRQATYPQYAMMKDSYMRTGGSGVVEVRHVRDVVRFTLNYLNEIFIMKKPAYTDADLREGFNLVDLKKYLGG